MCVYQRSHTLETTTASVSFPLKGCLQKGAGVYYQAVSYCQAEALLPREHTIIPFPNQTSNQPWARYCPRCITSYINQDKKKTKCTHKTQTQHKKKSRRKKYPKIVSPRMTQFLCPSIISVGFLVITDIIHSKKEAKQQGRKKLLMAYNCK